MSPEFSEPTKKKIQEAISRYPRKKAALLPVLHLTQKEFGKVSREEEGLIAQYLGIKPIQVREAVTFYSMIHQKTIGKYHIQVCRNLSCTLMGAENLIHYIKEKLKIKEGETTPDHKFSFSTVECLGACEKAPCMMVNFDYYGHLNKKKIDEILDRLE